MAVDPSQIDKSIEIELLSNFSLNEGTIFIYLL